MNPIMRLLKVVDGRDDKDIGKELAAVALLIILSMIGFIGVLFGSVWLAQHFWPAAVLLIGAPLVLTYRWVTR